VIFVFCLASVSLQIAENAPCCARSPTILALEFPPLGFVQSLEEIHTNRLRSLLLFHNQIPPLRFHIACSQSPPYSSPPSISQGREFASELVFCASVRPFNRTPDTFSSPFFLEEKVFVEEAEKLTRARPWNFSLYSNVLIEPPFRLPPSPR